MNALPWLVQVDGSNTHGSPSRVGPRSPKRLIDCGIKEHGFAVVAESSDMLVVEIRENLVEVFRTQFFGLIMGPCCFGSELAVDNDLPIVGSKADIRLHLRQKAIARATNGDELPLDVLTMNVEPVAFVFDSKKVAHEFLEEECHLPFILDEIHKLARARCFRDQQVPVDEFANLQQKVVKLVVSVELYLAEDTIV